MNKTQLAVIAGALILVVLLYIAPRTSSEEQKIAVEAKTAGHSFEAHIEDAKKGIDSVGLVYSRELEAKLKRASDVQKIVLLDSLVNLWNDYKIHLVAAYYSQQSAVLEQTAASWKNAAERYFFASRFADEHNKVHIFENAIQCYNKLLALDPSDIDAKINLGVCYVESSLEPMKGIALLREVLEKDSNNIKAHLNLGYFSVKSGQYDKAIQRFEKVLELDPSYIDAYLYLGDVYESKGNKEKAIESYEKYKAAVNDPGMIPEIDKYIEKLKNSNNT